MSWKHCFGVVGLLACSLHLRAQYIPVPPDSGSSLLFKPQQVSRLLDHRLHALQKLARKEQRQTQQVLARLTRKERRLYSKINTSDSSLAAQLQQGVSYDSLARLEKDSTACRRIKTFRSPFAIDSLKRIAAFAQQKMAAVPGTNMPDFPDGKQQELARLQQQLDYNSWVQQQVRTRKQQLLQSAANIAGTKGLLKGIDKQAYYYNQKLKGWKAIASDPDALEAKALDYLRGMKGFEEAVAGKGMTGSGGNSLSMQDMKPEDLEKMGFQTRNQVAKSIDQKFGLSQNPEALKGVNEKLQAGAQQLNQYKSQFNDAKNQLNDAKKRVTGFKNIERPSFKVNPMRGLPFRQRIEKGFNWSVKPAAGGQPAILDLGMQVGFKHTTRLTYSLGLGGAVGLGQNWYNTQLSYQGISARASIDWKWIWGISGQAGYARLYKNYSRSYVSSATSEIPGQIITQTFHYRDIAYAGLMKTYKISPSINGTMLLAYDFLRRYGSSPFIFQIGLKK